MVKGHTGIAGGQAGSFQEQAGSFWEQAGVIAPQTGSIQRHARLNSAINLMNPLFMPGHLLNQDSIIRRLVNDMRSKVT